jgi:cysteinyl-tRNA synthetase
VALLGILGLSAVLPAATAGAEVLKPLVELLLALRAEAKVRKDFAWADRIRAGLQEAGIEVGDKAGGKTEWNLRS